MLALHGFDASGLEVSQTAVNVANNYAVAELSKPANDHFAQSQPARESVFDREKGNVQFVSGDFFKIDWESQCQREIDQSEAGFDLIYDYTVSRRSHFRANVLSQALGADVLTTT